MTLSQIVGSQVQPATGRSIKGCFHPSVIGSSTCVLIEHIDRLGRDSELVWAFYKTATHADTEIHQLGRGKLGMMDVGVLSTFAALFLEELGKKTRRGLEGKVAGGKSGGGLYYGYRVATGSYGETLTGEFAIVDEQTAIIRRIFQEYANGKSPQKIAEGLNHDGIPAPRGRGAGSGHWKQNTINGNRARAIGS